MSNTTHVDIVTPDGRVYEGEVNLVSAMTADGAIGVMAKHMPLVTALEIGIVTLRIDEGEDIHAAVAGGFIEVTPNHVSIIAEIAELKEHIDLEHALRAKERAEKHLEELHEEHKDFEHAKANLKHAVNRIDVAKKNKTEQ